MIFYEDIFPFHSITPQAGLIDPFPNIVLPIPANDVPLLSFDASADNSSVANPQHTSSPDTPIADTSQQTQLIPSRNQLELSNLQPIFSFSTVIFYKSVSI